MGLRCRGCAARVPAFVPLRGVPRKGGGIVGCGSGKSTLLFSCFPSRPGPSGPIIRITHGERGVNSFYFYFFRINLVDSVVINLLQKKKPVMFVTGLLVFGSFLFLFLFQALIVP